jgi:amidase
MIKTLEKAMEIGGKDGLNCIAGLINPSAVEEITAKSAPEGPLAGVPILVKDNIDVAGFPTTA